MSLVLQIHRYCVCVVFVGGYVFCTSLKSAFLTRMPSVGGYIEIYHTKFENLKHFSNIYSIL